MEKGIIFAFLAAIVFSAGIVLFKKGASQTGEALSGTMVCTFTGGILFLLLLLPTGDWSKLWALSWQGFVSLALAGIIHFAVSRLLYFKSIQLIGANKASTISKTTILWTVAVGVIFLREPLTIFLALGALCLTTGAILAGVERQSEVSRIHTKGVLAALGAALLWAIAAGLVKPALAEIGSPLAATFISYIAASLVMTGFLPSARRRKQLTQLTRPSLFVLVISGLCIGIAQLFRYLSFNYLPISVSQPLIGTDTIFTLFFSFLINRNIEVFNWKVITGMVITVIGAFFIVY